MKTLALLLLPRGDPAIARARATEARERAEGRIGLFDGVRGVSMGRAGAEYRLIIVVDNLLTKARAREALGAASSKGIRSSGRSPAPGCR